MRFYSITVKLLAIIIGAFVFMTLGILMLADNQLKQILDKSQESLYIERIDTIIGILSRSNERLNKTGLVDAYIDDFKQTTLNTLRKAYYTHTGQKIYPFIIDTGGTVIMHPVLPEKDTSLKGSPIARKMLVSPEGNFYDTYQDQKKWYIYKKFDGWSWVTGYAVPLSIKYGEARSFRNSFILIMIVITIYSLLMLTLIVTRFTMPETGLKHSYRKS